MCFKLLTCGIVTLSIILCSSNWTFARQDTAERITQTENPGQEEYDSLTTLLHRLPNDTNKIIVLNQLCRITHRESAELSFKYAKMSLLLSQLLNHNRFIAIANNLIGLSYLNNLKYDESLEYFVKSMHYFESTGDNHKVATQSNNIGLVYHNLGRLDKAKYYYKKTLILDSFDNYNRLIANTNLGNLYGEERDQKKSIQYYKVALGLAKKEKRFGYVSLLYANIGAAFNDSDQPDSAQYYINKGLNEPQISLDERASCLYVLGEIALKRHNASQALTYFIDAERIKIKINDFENLEQYKSMSAAYALLGEDKKAISYLSRAYSIRDSTINEQTISQISKIQKGYEIEKREDKIKVLMQEQLITEAKMREQQQQRNFILIISILLFLLTGIGIRNLVLKQRVKSKLLNEEKVLLQHENITARYEVLKSKTNPHFLFNSLNILTSIVMKDRDSAVEFIENFSDLYRMILQTEDHKLISVKKEQTLVQNYLYLQKKRFGNNLQVSINIADEKETYQVPPFSVQLLVENAIKHNIIMDEAPALHLRIYTEGDYLVVKNNLQKKETRVPSTLTGQKNITGRYIILSEKLPEFVETADEYIVRLPMLPPEFESINVNRYSGKVTKI
jgi:tetratricopeptide (TPR) repeat protein